MVTQSEYWNGNAGKKWASLANNQDTLLGKLGEGTMDSAGLSPGQTVLDIGCGSGGSTFEISRRIGADGTIPANSTSHSDVVLTDNASSSIFCIVMRDSKRSLNVLKLGSFDHSG